ncbi:MULTISPECIES: glutamate racemase [unclassified Spirosoma]|uniref:glutamate racemase n=1 Tax=unclassified Spirosoma TaxID=2621999 RepID=UPI00096383FB|nr:MULTISPECIES: glutamate racemase [unclassified Spirosoma]MBN8821489.1 glutamate racemase [Spirosoma sp.]OJW78269.1 MAG: glutamate racemase [Spirosoma sp. 48-14]
MTPSSQPIGVFDSGYGGLTILREIVKTLPQYDYVYLGDNARTPYGTRSFETVYHYTLECVQHLFDRGCRLVILACNTASAKALRNIQQLDLPTLAPGPDGPSRRVLGVIRPTTEVIGNYSKTGNVGILATRGTVTSESYVVEIEKAFPAVKVFQEACPMWVPLVENGEYDHPGADYFVKQHLDRLLLQSTDIDTILLACTHYPLLLEKIRQYAPAHATILSQGGIVAESLANYLTRHPEIEAQCSKHGQRAFLTTDSTEDFDRQATIFYGEPVQSAHLVL